MKHLFYLNKFFWKYRKLLLIGTFFIVVANLFALYPAEFVRKAFDAVLLSMKEGTNTEQGVKDTLLKYGGLIVAFAILKGVFMYFMRQTVIVMSRKIEFDLKNEIYQQYQNLSMSFYKQNKTGDLMNRISEDVSRVRMYLGPALMYAINISILFYLVISKMLSISTTLTFYVLLPLPILAILVYFVSSNINKRSEKVQAQLSKLTTISQETLLKKQKELGMAPMRSHLYELFKTLKTGRKVSYWYGGRSKAELFYIEHFRSLEREFSNFKFYLVLSDAQEGDNWKPMQDMNDTEGDGFVGFVHQVVIDQYLTKHEAPEDIELYFCGPPMMNQAVLKMADDWGIPDENVRFDDFGG